MSAAMIIVTKRICHSNWSPRFLQEDLQVGAAVTWNILQLKRGQTANGYTCSRVHQRGSQLREGMETQATPEELVQA